MQIKTWLKENIYLWITLIIVIILVLIPILNIISSIGYDWQGVPPMFTGDSHFYFSRMKEISDGNIFIGNPFFIEHNKEVAPAFFFADWIAATPLLVGFSFNFTVIFNLFFWSLAFTLLFYYLLRQFGIAKLFCFLGAILMYIEVYRLMFRPVSMQTIFPFFILFLLAFIIWFKNPYNKKAMIFLTIATALAFYVYTYLWQIILVFIFLTIAYLYIIRARRKANNLLIVIFLAHILSIPLIIYTIKQISHPYYWESMERTGLIYTHLPAVNVVYSGIWIMLALILLAYSYSWVKEFRNNEDYKNLFVFSALSGWAMLIVSGSNLITGKEMENSQHVERFIIVWLVIVLSGYISYLIKDRINFKQITFRRKLILLILLLFCLIGVIRYLQALTGANFLLTAVSQKINPSIIKAQDYSRPLNWLEKNEVEPKVIWTDSRRLDHYITILTKHYILFKPSGLNYIMPTKEVEKRYLIYNYFNDLEQSDIENDYWNYAGVGNAIHKHKTHNRKVKVCKLLYLNKFGKDCGEIKGAVEFKGKEYFNDLHRQYIDEIRPNIDEKLEKYQVAYIIKDIEFKSDFQPEILNSTELVYEDERFLIYRIDY